MSKCTILDNYTLLSEHLLARWYSRQFMVNFHSDCFASVILVLLVSHRCSLLLLLLLLLFYLKYCCRFAWQVRKTVDDYVKVQLKEPYSRGQISKDDYKWVREKAVSKVRRC